MSTVKEWPSHWDLTIAEDRDRWLAMRDTSIGASETSAALGLDPYRSPYTLAAMKLRLIEPEPENERMRLGRRQERVIADELVERLDIEIAHEQVFARSVAHPFLTATLDAVTTDMVAMEFKAVQRRPDDLGEAGSDIVPHRWYLQAQQQLLCSGLDRCIFGVLIGGLELETFEVERHDGVIAEMVPRLGEFWDLIQAGKLPEPTRAADAAVLAKLTDGPTGTVALPPPIVDLVDEYERIGSMLAELKTLEERRSDLKAQILGSLRDHATGVLPDGRQVKQSLVRVKERTQTVKAFQYLRLSIKGGSE